MPFRMQPKRKSVKRKSFQCVLFFAPSPYSLTHSFIHSLTLLGRAFGVGGLLSKWKDSRDYFQVVMAAAAAATMNENNVR